MACLRKWKEKREESPGDGKKRESPRGRKIERGERGEMREGVGEYGIRYLLPLQEVGRQGKSMNDEWIIRGTKTRRQKHGHQNRQAGEQAHNIVWSKDASQTSRRERDNKKESRKEVEGRVRKLIFIPMWTPRAPSLGLVPQSQALIG